MAILSFTEAECEVVVDDVISFIIMLSELLIFLLSSLVERERETAARVGRNENEVNERQKTINCAMKCVIAR